MKSVTIKSVELKGLQARMLQIGTFYRITVIDKNLVRLVDNCYTDFTGAIAAFDSIAECFSKEKRK